MAGDSGSATAGASGDVSGGYGNGARGVAGTAVVGSGGVMITGARACPVTLSVGNARAFAVASPQVVALVVRAIDIHEAPVAEAATVEVEVRAAGAVVGTGAGRVAAGRANVFVELDAGPAVGTLALVARLHPETGSDLAPSELEATFPVVDAPLVTRLSTEAANDDLPPRRRASRVGPRHGRQRRMGAWWCAPER